MSFYLAFQSPRNDRSTFCPSRRAVTVWFLALGVFALVATPALAGFLEGRAAYRAKNFGSALNEFRPAADRGHAGAQNSLGYLYSKGNGVPRDSAAAAAWYRKAAEQGHAMAQHNLGMMYRLGRGVPENKVEAYK